MGSNPDRLLTVPDVIAVKDNKITIIKPLVTRFWLEREAIEDANKLAAEITRDQALEERGMSYVTGLSGDSPFVELVGDIPVSTLLGYVHELMACLCQSLQGLPAVLSRAR